MWPLLQGISASQTAIFLLFLCVNCTKTRPHLLSSTAAKALPVVRQDSSMLMTFGMCAVGPHSLKEVRFGKMLTWVEDEDCKQ
ncbi:hypothetical protein BDV98DRAFT_575042 [Pterulicium gracile]|uniref:Uncharacterized protein n=1 Tax=Pterulicium gracile TaxID=1884261 RepID=A0A5C3QAH0_9AGAR|nr:hypothetical protein BDV98DRAFT_575042 [Pterula gracilis]